MAVTPHAHLHAHPPARMLAHLRAWMRQVLSPLLEEAALGCRLLPSAAAAAAAAADEDSAALPLCVPRAVRIWGALARLRTPEVHGVHLASSVDAGERKHA